MRITMIKRKMVYMAGILREVIRKSICGEVTFNLISEGQEGASHELTRRGYYTLE